MIQSIKNWIRGEIVLVAAWFFALVSLFFVPPSGAYFAYINVEVLVILFCLMAVVAGFIKTGLFSVLSTVLLGKSASFKKISTVLVLLCFFSAMIVTNDVALITFVPLALSLLADYSEKKVIFVVVLQTIAANIGSMLTPIGNPQNLYLYAYYTMNLGNFIIITAPFCIAGFFLLLVCILFGKNEQLVPQKNCAPYTVHGILFFLYTALFVLSIAVVLRLVDYRLCFAITVATLIFFDRQTFTKIDYSLLAIFTAFFIFVGNLGNITPVKNMLSSLINGKEFFTAVAASQIISNVPAAVMLSGFTQNAKALLLGANIGGLGTLIASLASVISFKLYAKKTNAQPLRYLAVFTLYNVVFLFLLSAAAVWTLKTDL